jgi:hypothetical protein
MKRLTLYFSLIAIVFALSLTSCDQNVESSKWVINVDDSAGITVHLFAELDRTSAGLETVPAETPVKISIPYSNFKPGVNGTWEKTVMTNAQGVVSFKVPTIDNGVTVKVSPLPFQYAQVQPFGQNDIMQTVNKLYQANALDVSVVSGDNKIEQLNYNAPVNFNNYVRMVKLEGTVTAETNDTIAGSEELTKNITLTFHTNDWFEQITTNKEIFSVEVPANVDISVTAIFTEGNYLAAEAKKIQYEYELDAVSIGDFGSSTKGIVIDFGTGIAVEE